MPVFAVNRSPKPMRNALSTPSDPRTDPRPKKMEEDVKLLRSELNNLRKQNTALNKGIKNLEAEIGENAFKRLVEQVASPESSLVEAEEYSSCTEELKKQQIESIKNSLNPKLLKYINNKDEEIFFASIDIRECQPKIFYAQWNNQNLLSIIGPNDIRKRTFGSVHIADRILSIDTLLIDNLFSDNNQKEIIVDTSLNYKKEIKDNNKKILNTKRIGGDEPNNVKELAQLNSFAHSTILNENSHHSPQSLDQVREFVEEYLKTKLSKEVPFLVLGLLRQSTKLMALTGEWVQVQILHLPNEPEGLGFGIVGGHSTGVVIKSIVAGSVADKDQRLRPGDRILQIGHISTQGLNSQQIAALLRQQDGPYVQMTVAHSIQLQDTETTDTPMCWTMATRAALSATTLDEEVQRRLELMASKPSTSRCNGINHSKTTPATLNEGTEFPDQLINRLGPETVLKGVWIFDC
uniref:PDZ domain-containing protein n=1 Tax=Meloidogyne incognita TaxID=6306 RepID=A0A914LPT8_MELIC